MIDVPAVIGHGDQARSGVAAAETEASGVGANGLVRVVVSAAGTVERLDIHPEVARRYGVGADGYRALAAEITRVVNTAIGDLHRRTVMTIAGEARGYGVDLEQSEGEFGDWMDQITSDVERIRRRLDE